MDARRGNEADKLLTSQAFLSLFSCSELPVDLSLAFPFAVFEIFEDLCVIAMQFESDEEVGYRMEMMEARARLRPASEAPNQPPNRKSPSFQF